MAKQNTSKAGPDLVIVESPAKAKTINKYLGSGYVVKASMGHVRDLPERSIAIDVENNFQPTYEVVAGRKRVLAELKKHAAKASTVYLATDLDREGEAIAWHLAAALELDPERIRRVIFNEITKPAVRAAFANPHQIDMDKVNAQQARRILDRIVGYELSPLLWKKIAKGLSAGRVQSVAVRLIVDREEEIRAFIPTESWRITACFTAAVAEAAGLGTAWAKFLNTGEEEPKLKDQAAWLASHSAFRAELVSVAGKEFKPQGRITADVSPEKAFTSGVDDAAAIAEALGFVCTDRRERTWEPYANRGLRTVELVGRFDPAKAPAFRIADIQTRRTKSKPAPPFTTAALQQAAANQLHFATSRTMRIAQQLYEGIDIGNSEGVVGLITYMRTDSTNLSNESVAATREWIGQSCGDAYLPAQPNRYASSKRAQEAHEAIRATNVQYTPDSLRGHLNDEQWKLYDLIWRRFVACQMTAAEWDSTTVTVEADTPRGAAAFRASGRTLVFDGYYKVLGLPKSGDEQILPPLKTGQPAAPFELVPRQHFTSPPPRYTEASLVKALEAEGIGRPSTYAAIIQTIQDRGYVEQIERRFFATDKGEVVTRKLLGHFPELMDVKFTSYMEEELDKIEEAHLDWVHVLHEFYDPFHRSLIKAHNEMEATRAEPSEYVCETCGKPMVYRWARTGRFLSCSGYPECKAAFNIDRDGKPLVPKAVDVKCEKCGKPMLLRQSRHGLFLGCSGYPECNQTIACDAEGQPLKLVKEEDIQEACELCGSPMAVKRKGRRAFLGCSNYPTCKNTKSLPEGIRLESKPVPPPEEAGFACEKCGKPMVLRTGRRGKFISCSGFPRCRNAKPIQKLEELKAAAAERARNAPPPESAEAATDESPTSDTPARTKPSKKTARKKPTAGKSPASKGTGKGRTPVDLDEAFVARAEAKGFGVTRYGNLYVDKFNGNIECPSCGEKMALKRGPWGPFLSCEGYPNCTMTARLRGDAVEQAKAQLGEPEKKPPPEPTDIDCDQCGAKMLIRTGRSGKFLGCSAYPKCRNTKPIPTDMLNLGRK
ncbi:MAG: type I DNA topoisomerase [Phycisphaerae bacterium]|nr:type I DNA topoisomerase [Phycisphaerae bacterium]